MILYVIAGAFLGFLVHTAYKFWCIREAIRKF
jgi:hypothetical protein